jgi:hypothetical protein
VTRRGLQYSPPTVTPIDTPAGRRQEGATMTTAPTTLPDTLDRMERTLLDLENLLAIATDALVCTGCRRSLTGPDPEATP